MAKAKVSKFKVGDAAKVINNTAGHGSKIGEKVIITWANSNGSSYNARAANGGVYAYNPIDLASAVTSKKDLETFIEEQEAEITTAKMKLKYLKETDSEEFDESEFKIYNALTILDGAKSKIEKARILKDILNG